MDVFPFRIQSAGMIGRADIKRILFHTIKAAFLMADHSRQISQEKKLDAGELLQRFLIQKKSDLDPIKKYKKVPI